MIYYNVHEIVGQKEFFNREISYSDAQMQTGYSFQTSQKNTTCII